MLSITDHRLQGIKTIIERQDRHQGRVVHKGRSLRRDRQGAIAKKPLVVPAHKATMSPSSVAHKSILASRGTGIRTAASSNALVAIRSVVPLTLVVLSRCNEEKLNERRER
jgi:hypothetical protein